eukprot:CAMPEP_0170367206 /NCGR_PEP_ID=MMETSP0117_2-20130122/6815_1 /TAXON_ID=400756 /ORGANISM="Durinskia baltica, Strain CSIRO CS-38" /LENGTH=201 /DNA_ID=CAMNT_0010621821 /DNA_START=75 /DNA_END=676 /DNA_ORIENTATION=-
MVIPMSAPGLQLPPEPPAEAAASLGKLKWSVVSLIIFGALRFLFAATFGILNLEFMSLLNVFLCIAMGAFILKEDKDLKKLYDCLSTTIFQMCAQRGMGGLQCLFPFVVCNGLNLFFDVISKSSLLGFHAYGIALLGNLVSEGAAVYYGWTVFKVCQASADQTSYEMEEGGGGGGYFQTGEGGSTRPPARAPAIGVAGGAG